MTDPIATADTELDPTAHRPVADALSHTLLSAEEEAELSKRMEVGTYAAHLLASGTYKQATEEELEWLVADGEEARRVFIESNLRLAFATSRKFRRRGYTEEDVVQDAYQGLVKAVDRFDYKKGFKFSTFAVWWIRESIHTGIRAAGFVKHPEVLFNQIVKVRAVKLRLIDETGQTPTLAEIAKEANLSERDVTRCLREDHTITSLQTPLGGDDLTLGEIVEDAEATHALVAAEESIDRQRLHVTLERLLHVLTDMDAAILRARYGLDGGPPRAINTVAAEMGLTRTYVRSREQRALYKLRHPGTRSSLEAYRDSGD